MLTSIFKKKPKLEKTHNKNTFKKSKYFVGGNYNTQKNINFKVFKPNPQKLFQEQIKTKIEAKTNLRLNGFKKYFAFFSRSKLQINLQSTNFRSLSKTSLQLINRYNLSKKLSTLTLIIFFWSFVLGIFYLSFFDTRFLVKNYAISFTKDSYLNPQEIGKITKAFENKKLFFAIPNNQYWFLNETNLTLLAKTEVPEVSKIKILKQHWPDKVSLEFETEPILATLGITESGGKKFWRISKSGKVVTQDESEIKQNLILVDKSVLFNQNGVTFQNYNLQNDSVQLNRLWFTRFLNDFFAKQETRIIATHFFSITDTDVVLNTSQNTELLFDSDIQNISKETLEARLNAFVNTNLIDSLNSGEMTYVDFRTTSGKIFLCYKKAECKQN